MKKLFLYILGTALFVVAVGLLFKNPDFFKFKNNLSTESTEVRNIKVDSKTIEVEVADSDQERTLGLGKRDSLSENKGMLFVFPKKSTMVNFWMKDMRFPIDIIWISNGKIVQIDKNAKVESGVSDSQMTIYSPGQPVDYVLEVNAGFCERNNIKTGSTFQMLFDL